MNLHARLWQFFQDNRSEWIPSGTLQRMVFRRRNGKVASPANITRRLRDLESGQHFLPDQGSLIAVRYINTAAQYRYIPKEWRGSYVPANQRAHQYSNDMWRGLQAKQTTGV